MKIYLRPGRCGPYRGKGNAEKFKLLALAAIAQLSACDSSSDDSMTPARTGTENTDTSDVNPTDLDDPTEPDTWGCILAVNGRTSVIRYMTGDDNETQGEISIATTKAMVYGDTVIGFRFPGKSAVGTVPVRQVTGSRGVSPLASLDDLAKIQITKATPLQWGAISYIVVSGPISGKFPKASPRDTLPFLAMIQNDALFMSTALPPLAQ